MAGGQVAGGQGAGGMSASSWSVCRLLTMPKERPVLLALDSATSTASIALYDPDAEQLLAEWTWQARRRQTQDLLVTAQTMLAQLDLVPTQLTALAATTGPGSFTGVRIAISAVKGMGIGLAQSDRQGPRVIGLPTLCVTAAPWLSVAQTTADASVIVCAYIQAGRGRYNWLFFGQIQPDTAAEERIRPALLPLPTPADHYAGVASEFVAELAQLAPHRVWLVGESAPDLAAVVQDLAHVTIVDDISGLRRAGQLAQLATTCFAQGMGDDLATLQPLYLRNP